MAQFLCGEQQDIYKVHETHEEVEQKAYEYRKRSYESRKKTYDEAEERALAEAFEKAGEDYEITQYSEYTKKIRVYEDECLRKYGCLS